MNILAIEASSDACSCALAARGCLSERHAIAPREHTMRLLPMIDDLLGEAGLTVPDLGAVAYGGGPGSFTGVRIAACAAQGIALAAGVGVIPVSSLAAMAARGGRPGERVLACLDARMGEVYLGAFELDPDGFPRSLAAEQLATPGAVSLPRGGAWVGVGPGWGAHGAALLSRLGASLLRTDVDAYPGAAQVAVLAMRAGPGREPAAALPSYLRRHVATPPARVAIPAK